MVVQFLVSVGVFIFPITVTLIALLSLEAYNEAHGLPRPFSITALTTKTYCQQFIGITPDTHGQNYTFNPNQWGIPADYSGPGSLCLTVTSRDNRTYATDTTAALWSTTWQFPPGPEDQRIRGYPNVMLDSRTTLPVQISHLGAIDVVADWTYGVQGAESLAMNLPLLEGVELDTNVSIDMFFDSDPVNATNTTSATNEVMIWLATFGNDTKPIGYEGGALETRMLNDTMFTLYFGRNQAQQGVLSWNSNETIANFAADIVPLLKDLERHGGPKDDDYLGYWAFGSEVFSAKTNVTFTNQRLEMAVKTI